MRLKLPFVNDKQCQHKHYQKWRRTILVDTTTCGDFLCEAHGGSAWLEGRQCIDCYVTWRVSHNGTIPSSMKWRDRDPEGTENSTGTYSNERFK